MRYAGFINAYLLKRTGDPNLAEELAAETWLHVWTGRDRYRDDGTPIAAWLVRIARNTHIDWWKSPRQQRPHVGLEAVTMVIAPDDPAYEAIIDESVSEAQLLLARLTPRRRAVLLLMASGYTNPEISERLGMTLSAIKSSAFQGRRQCRKWARRNE